MFELIIAIGGIILSVVTFLWGKKDGNRTKNSLEKKIKELEVQNTLEAEKTRAQYEKEAIKTREHQEIQAQLHGLTPLSNGLNGFEEEICSMVKHAQRSIKLCLATPLLYSWNARWVPYTTDAINNDSSGEHWARKFCEQLANGLRERRNAGNLLTLDFAYPDSKLMKKLLKEVPQPEIDSEEYDRSMRHFFDDVLRKDNLGSTETRLCNLHEYPVMDIPIFLTIVDCPMDASPEDRGSSYTCGVVAFMSSSQLCKQKSQDGRTSREIAMNLQAYKFSNPELVRFFGRVFKDLLIDNDEHLRAFVQHCRLNHFEWAIITDGDPGGRYQPLSTVLRVVEKDKDTPVVEAGRE